MCESPPNPTGHCETEYLGLDTERVERTLARLISAGLVGSAGHEPDGEPRYIALTA